MEIGIGIGDRPERAGGAVTATSCRDWRRGVAKCPTTDNNTDNTRDSKGVGEREGLYWGYWGIGDRDGI